MLTRYTEMSLWSHCRIAVTQSENAYFNYLKAAKQLYFRREKTKYCS